MWLLCCISFLIGFTIQGAYSGLYSAGASLYDSRCRCTGIGFGIGVGRIGAILSPTVGGLLMSLGWSRVTYFGLFALPFIAVALTVFGIHSERLKAAKAPGR